MVQQPGVTTVIPGARSAEQAQANAAAGCFPRCRSAFLDAVADLYDRRLRASDPPPLVMHRPAIDIVEAVTYPGALP